MYICIYIYINVPLYLTMSLDIHTFIKYTNFWTNNIGARTDSEQLPRCGVKKPTCNVSASSDLGLRRPLPWGNLGSTGNLRFVGAEFFFEAETSFVFSWAKVSKVKNGGLVEWGGVGYEWIW